MRRVRKIYEEWVCEQDMGVKEFLDSVVKAQWRLETMNSLWCQSYQFAHYGFLQVFTAAQVHIWVI